MARGGHLPGVSALLRRRERRRHGRPRGHPLADPLPLGARRRRDLAVPLLRLPPEGRRLRRRRLPRDRPAVRHPRRLRRDARGRPRGGHPPHRRPRPQPLLFGARVVQGRAGRRAGQRRARPLPLPRRRPGEARDAAEQLAVGLRRPRLDQDSRRQAVVPAPVRLLPAGPELGQPRGPRRVPVDPQVLARPRRRRLPHRRRPRHGQGRRAARHRRRRHDRDDRHDPLPVLRPGRRP